MPDKARKLYFPNKPLSDGFNSDGNSDTEVAAEPEPHQFQILSREYMTRDGHRAIVLFQARLSNLTDEDDLLEDRLFNIFSEYSEMMIYKRKMQLLKKRELKKKRMVRKRAAMAKLKKLYHRMQRKQIRDIRKQFNRLK